MPPSTEIVLRRLGSVRASDAERERAAAALRDHYADGRLTSEELEDRLQHVYTARSRADLARLLADLPSDRRRRALRGFYRWQRAALRVHAAGYVAGNGSLVGIWALTGEGYFWPAWALVPATMLLGWHATSSWLLRRTVDRGSSR